MMIGKVMVQSVREFYFIDVVIFCIFSGSGDAIGKKSLICDGGSLVVG